MLKTRYLAALLLVAIGCAGAPKESTDSPTDPAVPRAQTQTKPVVATPTQFFEALQSIANDGDAKPLVAAIPASYKRDIAELAAAAAASVDPALYEHAMVAANKLGQVTHTKAGQIIGFPMVSVMLMQPAQQLKMNPQDFGRLAKSMIEAAGQVLLTMSQSDLKSHRGLATIDVDAFFSASGARLLTDLHGLVKLIPASPDGSSTALQKAIANPGLAKFAVVESDATQAKVSWSIEGEPPAMVDVVCVDGCWIPKTIADDWSANLAATKSKLAGSPMSAEDVQMAQQSITEFESTLDQMLAAKTEDEFNMAFGTALRRMMQTRRPE